MRASGETINLFQQDLASTVLGYSLDAGHEITFRLAGKHELFVLVEVSGITVYIYSDGFDIHSASGGIRFEADDIKTVEEAKTAVMDALGEYLDIG